MKKGWIISFIVLIILVVGVCIYSNNKTVEQKFYTVPCAKSYIYDESRTISIDVYSTIKDPYIVYKEKNEYYLTSIDIEYSLDINSIDINKQEDVYLITLTAKMPKINNLHLKNVYLKIINKKYTLNCSIGSLDILYPEEYKLLSIDKLYGSYSYINNALHLVGVNIIFNSSPETIDNFMVGTTGYGYINSISEAIYENEIEIKSIIPSYNALYSNEKVSYKPKGNKFFIPIGYNKIILIKEGYMTLKINGELFYIDTFSFLASDIILKDYISYAKLGEIKYA